MQSDLSRLLSCGNGITKQKFVQATRGEATLCATLSEGGSFSSGGRAHRCPSLASRSLRLFSAERRESSRDSSSRSLQAVERGKVGRRREQVKGVMDRLQAAHHAGREIHAHLALNKVCKFSQTDSRAIVLLKRAGALWALGASLKSTTKIWSATIRLRAAGMWGIGGENSSAAFAARTPALGTNAALFKVLAANAVFPRPSGIPTATAKSVLATALVSLVKGAFACLHYPRLLIRGQRREVRLATGPNGRGNRGGGTAALSVRQPFPHLLLRFAGLPGGTPWTDGTRASMLTMRLRRRCAMGWLPAGGRAVAFCRLLHSQAAAEVQAGVTQ